MNDASFAGKKQQDLVEQIAALKAELEDVKARYAGSQDVLRAIHNGEVDALLVATPEGDRVFTLEGADQPYRVFIENIGEGAVTLTVDGTILYCNSRFTQMVQLPQEKVIGSCFFDYLTADCHPLASILLKQAAIRECKGEVELKTSEGGSLPLQLSVSNLRLKDSEVRCMVLTDLTEQKRNQEILSQERLTRSILEQTNEAIIICDEKGNIIRANNKAVSWGCGDVLFKHFDEAFDLRYTGQQTVPFCLSDIREGKKAPALEMQLLRRNGAPLFVVGNIMPLYNGIRKVIGCLITLYDITERKKAEQELFESREQWQTIANRFALLSEITAKLLRSDEPQKVVETLCRKAMEYLECQVFFNYLVYEKPAKLQLNACAGIPGDEAARISRLDYGAAVCGCVARDGSRIVAERIASTSDPRTDLVASYGVRAYACHPLLGRKGEVLGTLSFGTKNRDAFNGDDLAFMQAVADQISFVMTRLKDEKELKASHQQVNNILESISDGFMALDKEWRFTYINRRAAANVGFEPERLIGECLWKKFPNIRGSAHETNYRRAMEQRQQVSFEMPGVLAGSWYRLNVYPSTDGGVSVFWQDITERRQAEEVLMRDNETLEKLASKRARALLKAHAELERSKRMSDIGRLSSTIAHELRNPLSAICAAAYNLQRKAKDPQLAKHFETINKKVLESDHIIQNLLSFTRIKSATIEKLNICDLVKDCIVTVSAKYAGWDVQLKKELDCTKDDIIEADPVQFRMLFCNILDNAYQALPDKTGTITVTVRKHADEAWKIVIVDTGVGIDA
jgi:PAS domain S-box-containing protein